MAIFNARRLTSIVRSQMPVEHSSIIYRCMSELPQHYIPVVPRVERSIRPRYFYEQSDRGILVGMFLKTLRGFDNLCRLSRNKPLKPGDIYEVSVDMNGFKADEFAVTVKGNTVYVNATSDQYASRTDKVHYQMIREFEVPNVVDFNFASATYDHRGMLKIEAPVVALAEEKEMSIPVTVIAQPEPPSKNIPMRKMFARECDVCGPYGGILQAHPGEIHICGQSNNEPPFASTEGFGWNFLKRIFSSFRFSKPHFAISTMIGSRQEEGKFLKRRFSLTSAWRQRTNKSRYDRNTSGINLQRWNDPYDEDQAETADVDINRNRISKQDGRPNRRLVMSSDGHRIRYGTCRRPSHQTYTCPEPRSPRRNDDSVLETEKSKFDLDEFLKSDPNDKPTHDQPAGSKKPTK